MRRGPSPPRERSAITAESLPHAGDRLLGDVGRRLLAPDPPLGPDPDHPGLDVARVGLQQPSRVEQCAQVLPDTVPEQGTLTARLGGGGVGLEDSVQGEQRFLELAGLEPNPGEPSPPLGPIRLQLGEGLEAEECVLDLPSLRIEPGEQLSCLSEPGIAAKRGMERAGRLVRTRGQLLRAGEITSSQGAGQRSAAEADEHDPRSTQEGDRDHPCHQPSGPGARVPLLPCPPHEAVPARLERAGDLTGVAVRPDHVHRGDLLPFAQAEAGHQEVVRLVAAAAP